MSLRQKYAIIRSIQLLYKNKKGVALVAGLLFLAVLTILGTTAVITSTTDTKIGTNYRTSKQAFYAAEAGIEHFKGTLRSDTDWSDNGGVSGTLNNNSSYTVSVLESPAPTQNTIAVRSVGTFDGSTVTIEARFSKEAFGYALAADEDINVGRWE